jgi:large repetitive protein
LSFAGGSITFTGQQVAAGALGGLTITPTSNDGASGGFVLHVTATSTDGSAAPATVSRDLAVTVAVAGPEDQPILLPGLFLTHDVVAGTPTDVMISGLPGDAKLFDSHGIERTIVNGAVTFGPLEVSHGGLDSISLQLTSADDPGITLHVTTTNETTGVATTRDLPVTILPHADVPVLPPTSEIIVAQTNATSPTLTADGRFLFDLQFVFINGGFSNHLVKVDTLTGTVTDIPTPNTADRATPPSVSADGHFLAYYDSGFDQRTHTQVAAPTIYVIDTESGATVKTFVPSTSFGLNFVGATISSDGRFVVFETNNTLGTELFHTLDLMTDTVTAGGGPLSSHTSSYDGNITVGGITGLLGEFVTNHHILTTGENDALVLPIIVAEQGAADPDASTIITISGIPVGATVSDSHQNPFVVVNGTAILDSSQVPSHTLDGITITPGAGADGRFVLHVVETVTDGTGPTASTASASTDITIDVTLHAGVPALFLHGIEDQPIALPLVSELVARGVIDFRSSYALTLEGIPQDAVLTNGHHDTLTPDNGKITFTNAQVAAGALDGLAITPTDADTPSFALHLTADVAGHGTFNEDIKVTSADLFVLGANDLAAAQQATPVLVDILDYSNQKGDKIDLEALLDTAFRGGQPVTNLVQVTHDQNGTSATLSVDIGGTTTPGGFVPLAHLADVHAGDIVTAILDHAQHTAQVHVA